jgi:hypothetical protein
VLACLALFLIDVLERRERGPSGAARVHWPGRPRRSYLAAAGVCFTVCGLAIGWPLSLAPLVGVVAMTAVAIGALVVCFGEAQLYGETHRPSRGLEMLHITAIPVTTLVLAAFVIASLLDDGSYHAVARNGKAPPEEELTLEAAFKGWMDRNCADKPGHTVPMVFIASHGGGIRAGYWTMSVLTQLFGAPATEANDPVCGSATTFDRVFAMGGTSGGALGVTSYASHAKSEAGLLVDLPRTLIGFGGPDRARKFEELWEHRDPTLKRDFFASQSPQRPLLLLSGTQVESGCRLSISPLRLTPDPNSDLPGDCGALVDRGVVDVTDDPSEPILPGAPLTSDVLDHLCAARGSFNRSTAALMSARFAYVSPSGQLAGYNDVPRIAVVDGGYAENTGGQAILNLWARLQPLVASHNASGHGARIVPIYVDIDNHYRLAAKAGTVARTHELIVPPAAKPRPDKLDDHGVEQLANAEFSIDLPGLRQRCSVANAATQRFVYIAPPKSPGVPAPLAWTLSAMAMDDLDDQRTDAFGTGQPASKLKAFLAGTGTCAGLSAAP